MDGTPCGIILGVADDAQRITARVLDCLARYEAGVASVADLQGAASAAALALDGANADLRAALERLDPALEGVQFIVSAADRPEAVARAFEEFRGLARVPIPTPAAPSPTPTDLSNTASRTTGPG